MLLARGSFGLKDTHWKWRDGKIWSMQMETKRAGVLISHKLDFKPKTVIRDKEGHFVVIKWLVPHTWRDVEAVHAKSSQSCLTLCNTMACSLPGSSVHGIFQARVLEWVAISSSRRSFWPRNQACVSCISCTGRQILLEDVTTIYLCTWQQCLKFMNKKTPNFGI